MSALELIQLFQSGVVSPVDAVEACLAQIDRTDPAIRAVITRLGDSALQAAIQSAVRYRAGTARPLEGVPYALKDVIAAAGIPTTGSSLIYEHHVTPYNATVTSRMNDAGAILLAKVNTFPFAMGFEGDEAFGPTVNPWDTRRTTGGSSAGSAAACAARQVPIALGTDTGGSIRLPAAWCGISGLKPTNGRVPLTGLMPLSWTLDTVGPMARSAEDLALVLGVIAGPDGKDLSCWPAPVGDYLHATRCKPSSLRIGVPETFFLERCAADVVSAVRDATGVFAGLGVEIVDIDLPNAELSMELGWTIVLAELGALHEANRDRRAEYDPTFAQYLVDSDRVTSSDYLRCLRGRTVLQKELADAFRHVDALLVPGNAATAPLLSDMLLDLGDEQVPWLELAARHTFPFNLTGVPAVAVPAGLDARGLPVAIQLVAAPFREDICLGLAAAYQRETAYHRLMPPLAQQS